MLHNRIYSTIRYSAQFILLGLICLVFVAPNSSDLPAFSMSFVIIALPLSIIGQAKSIIKADISDGSMELLIVTTESIKIALVKYISLLLASLSALIIVLPFAMLFCFLTYEQILLVLASSTLLLAQIASLSILTSSIEGYFRTNTNLISLTILPLIIPGVIVSGLSIHNSTNCVIFIWMLGGITMVITPIAIYLSSYLIRNIYNT